MKTSVVTYLEKARDADELPPRADVAASIQEAIVDVLVDKTFNAVDATGAEAVAGGGGGLAIRRLRVRRTEEAERRGIGIYLPSPALSTDNGAMVAAVGVDRYLRGVAPDTLDSDVDPGMRLGV